MGNRIVVASGNGGKIKEIREILDGYDVVGYKELGYDFEIEETGKSFYENALIKAKAVYDKVEEPVLADDSGLCVKALNGAPGIMSARYSGGTDRDNIEKLLNALKGEKDRSAYFNCTLVLYYGKDNILTVTGETHGSILTGKSGENGFGYDPIFYSNDLKKSFGESSSEEKNSVSHRARALKKLREEIK